MDNIKIQAENWARKRLATPPSDATVQQYINIARRLKKQLNEGILPGSSNNRRTRSVERSAFRYVCARVILENNAKGKYEQLIKVYALVKKIDQVAQKAQINYFSGKSFPNAQKRKSKRCSLSGLEKDWREVLVKKSSNSKYADPIRVMAICGCRPKEMENGVEVTRQRHTISITIKGAKCSVNNNAGQESRTLVFDSNHPLIGGIKDGLYIAKAKAIEDAISHFSKEINDKKKKNKTNKISAYSLRHAAASDFKASGLSEEDISAALGHQSTVTKSFYGTKNKGSGGLCLKSVTATTPVRKSSKVQKINAKI